MGEPRFVAVDWGTTSFRLWLLASDGSVLRESRSAEGMTTARQTGFPQVLDRHLGEIDAPAGVPVIMCGMVGARQGWMEAGYIDVPAKLSDISSRAVRVPHATRDIRILPGLAQRSVEAADVMRGEETQLLGSRRDLAGKACLVAMPGTHSKWVRVAGQDVTGFSTFMTGELFDVITRQSILQHAVEGSAGFGGDSAAFLAAVRAGYAEPGMATNRLFSVRAGGLLHSLAPADAEATISGLLMGLELAGALGPAPGNIPVILVASGKLGGLYRAALRSLGIDATAVDADEAVRRGLFQAADEIWPCNEGSRA